MRRLYVNRINNCFTSRTNILYSHTFPNNYKFHFYKFHFYFLKIKSTQPDPLLRDLVNGLSTVVFSGF